MWTLTFKSSSYTISNNNNGYKALGSSCRSVRPLTWSCFLLWICACVWTCLTVWVLVHSCVLLEAERLACNSLLITVISPRLGSASIVVSEPLWKTLAKDGDDRTEDKVEEMTTGDGGKKRGSVSLWGGVHWLPMIAPFYSTTRLRICLSSYFTLTPLHKMTDSSHTWLQVKAARRYFSRQTPSSSSPSVMRARTESRVFASPKRSTQRLTVPNVVDVFPFAIARL